MDKTRKRFYIIPDLDPTLSWERSGLLYGIDDIKSRRITTSNLEKMAFLMSKFSDDPEFAHKPLPIGGGTNLDKETAMVMLPVVTRVSKRNGKYMSSKQIEYIFYFILEKQKKMEKALEDVFPDDKIDLVAEACAYLSDMLCYRVENPNRKFIERPIISDKHKKVIPLIKEGLKFTHRSTFENYIKDLS